MGYVGAAKPTFLRCDYTHDSLAPNLDSAPTVSNYAADHPSLKEEAGESARGGEAEAEAEGEGEGEEDAEEAEMETEASERGRKTMGAVDIFSQLTCLERQSEFFRLTHGKGDYEDMLEFSLVWEMLGLV